MLATKAMAVDQCICPIARAFYAALFLGMPIG